MWYKPKEPYLPWEVKESDFPKKGSIEQQAKFLLNYALLAPSTFNVQPWLFSVNKNKVTIHPDYSRKLKTSDKENRLLYISLGCALKNFETATEAFGFKISKKYLKKEGRTVVEVTLHKYTPMINKTALNVMKKRLTNRNPYTPKPIPKRFFNEIYLLSKRFGLGVKIISKKDSKEKIMELVKKGDYTLWRNENFKKEHLKWVRNNVTRKKDGMPAFTVGIPLLISFFAEFAIKKLDYAKIQSKKNQSLLITTPFFGFILSKEHDQETWIKVGEVLEEVWLNATREGVSLAPMAQIMAVGGLYIQTKKILRTGLRPQFFFRLGYATKPAHHSPRRNLSETLTQ